MLVKGAKSTFNLLLVESPMQHKNLYSTHISLKLHLNVLMATVRVRPRDRHTPLVCTHLYSHPMLDTHKPPFPFCKPFFAWIHLHWFVWGCTGHSSSHRGWKGEFYQLLLGNQPAEVILPINDSVI